MPSSCCAVITALDSQNPSHPQCRLYRKRVSKHGPGAGGFGGRAGFRECSVSGDMRCWAVRCLPCVVPALYGACSVWCEMCSSVIRLLNHSRRVGVFGASGMQRLVLSHQLQIPSGTIRVRRNFSKHMLRRNTQPSTGGQSVATTVLLLKQSTYEPPLAPCRTRSDLVIAKSN